MECGRSETGAVDWEGWKEMVVTGSERVSEGKTMASDGCGGGIRQGSVQGSDTGVVQGFRQGR